MISQNEEAIKEILEVDYDFIQDSHSDSQHSMYKEETIDGPPKVKLNVSSIKHKQIKYFPNANAQCQKRILYRRAMDNFSKANHQRNLSNADVLSKNAIEFFHFHIEAFDDKIAINKFKDKATFKEMNPRMVRPGSAVVGLENSNFLMKKYKDP